MLKGIKDKLISLEGGRNSLAQTIFQVANLFTGEKICKRFNLA
tara:strand:+ start:280 stop:408 length:129 start_codon:yes stop_codon:yes gene_type:complete